MRDSETYEDVICVREVDEKERYKPTREQLERASKIAEEEFARIEYEQRIWQEQNPGKELPKAKLTKLIVVDKFGNVITDTEKQTKH